MDARSSGAATLLAALSEACEVFQRYGQRATDGHDGAQWELVGRFGPGEAPYALVGVVVRVGDRTVDLGVDLWVREGAFEVSGYATVDGRRLLLDLPDVLTTDLDEALATVGAYTAQLCADDLVLGDLPC